MKEISNSLMTACLNSKYKDYAKILEIERTQESNHLMAVRIAREKLLASLLNRGYLSKEDFYDASHISMDAQKKLKNHNIDLSL